MCQTESVNSHSSPKKQRGRGRGVDEGRKTRMGRKKTEGCTNRLSYLRAAKTFGNLPQQDAKEKKPEEKYAGGGGGGGGGWGLC